MTVERQPEYIPGETDVCESCGNFYAIDDIPKHMKEAHVPKETYKGKRSPTRKGKARVAQDILHLFHEVDKEGYRGGSRRGKASAGKSNRAA